MNSVEGTKPGFQSPSFVRRLIFYFVMYSCGMFAILLSEKLLFEPHSPFDSGAEIAGAVGFAIGMAITPHTAAVKISKALWFLPLVWLTFFAFTWDWKRMWPTFPPDAMVRHGVVTAACTVLYFLIVQVTASLVLRESSRTNV